MQWIKYMCVVSPKDEKVVYSDAWLLTNEKGEPIAVIKKKLYCMFNIFKIRRKVDEKRKALLKNGVRAKRKIRERLQILHYIKTDYAEYFVYNTQTIKDDCVNIEIERADPYGKKELVCVQEIFDECWGSMGGDSFTTQVLRALCDLKDFIKDKREFIIEDKRIN